MTDDRRSPRGLLREAMLNLGAGLGVLCLLAAVASIGFGIRPLIFRSGSMGPFIDTGALGLARTVSAADLAVGDVVSVVDGRGVRITHRIQTVRYSHPTATLTLRGDANATADAVPYVVTEADRLIWSVNGLGHVVSAVSGPWGTFAGGLGVGALLMYAFGRRRPPDAGSSPSRATTLTALLALVVGTAALVRPPALDTAAAFTDAAGATAGTFAAVQLTAPQAACGSRGIGFVEVTWNEVAGATGYRVTLTTPAGGTPVTTTVASSPRVFRRNSGSLTESGTIVVRALAAPWTSPASNSVSYAFLIGLLPTCSA